ncbi:unnamed protein product [Spirodela intermedia]|uniref:Glycosyltransferase 61 catalytic domain-containing protein n=1 Tax=Spirodela intermedia TaxID=51605 RepID=A0A7I8I8Q4_SPIIN|nr:unnamed protein product [Spirodela intermedia]CAA6654047.1 unnamed protein product [Spirodela intermedia]
MVPHPCGEAPALHPEMGDQRDEHHPRARPRRPQQFRRRWGSRRRPPLRRCPRVPAVVFSTGGYTGNLYHEFNDGLIPLFITSLRYNRRVVFVILEYHSWWLTKYGDVTVGLRIHDELAVDPPSPTRRTRPSSTSAASSTPPISPASKPFNAQRRRRRQQRLAAAAAAPAAVADEEKSPPKLLIISRNGSRGLENEKELKELCEEMGFKVAVLLPKRTTELAKIYRKLNSSDAMVGVHGAAMTHLLFMRPGAVFIQVVPLGTAWAAEAYYGDPAKKMGLKYIPYRIKPSESSLSRVYEKDDPVLRDPTAVAGKGWEVTKRVYLDGQTVRLDLNRFLKRLTRAYRHIMARRMAEDHSSLSWNENWLTRQQREQRRRRSAI